MTTLRERWILVGTLLITVFFTCFFIYPNYRGATRALNEVVELEGRVEQLQRRQAEVTLLLVEFEEMEARAYVECKHVPKTPELASIMRTLSLKEDGIHVIDQTFDVGENYLRQESDEGFLSQPLAVTMTADFDSIIRVLQMVESMDRLVRVSSVRITRSESEADISEPMLSSAIGLHAMYDYSEEP